MINLPLDVCQTLDRLRDIMPDEELLWLAPHERIVLVVPDVLQQALHLGYEAIKTPEDYAHFNVHHRMKTK